MNDLHERFAASAIAVLVLVALLLSAACQTASEPEPEEAPGERVENPAIGLAISELAPSFRVVTNLGETLVLEPVIEDLEVEGRLEILAEPTGSSTNLVAAVNNHADEIGSRPDGAYKGQRELGSPLGTAYYSRGQYTADDGRSTEETIIMALHPDGDRIVRLRYRYPAGSDSTERLQSMFDILGELEGIFPEPGAPEQS